MPGPFSATQDYSAVLNKVGLSTFVVLLALGYGFYYTVPEFGALASRFPLQFEVAGTEVNGLIFVLAFSLASLFRMVKLHDRISDLFAIRHWYDVNNIVLPLALGARADVDDVRYHYLLENRQAVMRKIFYPYVRKDAGIVDPHLVTMLFDQFSWYWIALEAGTVLFAGSIMLYVLGNYFAAATVQFSVIAIYLLSRTLKRACIKYSLQEVEQILSDPEATSAIAAHIDALPSR